MGGGRDSSYRSKSRSGVGRQPPSKKGGNILMDLAKIKASLKGIDPEKVVSNIPKKNG